MSIANNGALDVALTAGGGTPLDYFLSSPEITIAAGVAPGSQIQLGDINGDGKADYLILPPTGSVTAWLNNGGTYQAKY